MSEEVARAAAEASDFVSMGCPNVVRGGSHLGWASAARLAEVGVCTVLTSDYYYPAMMRAAFVLASRGVLDLPRAWALISANPARAGGLADRGTIATGKRADVVVVNPATSRAVATIVGGQVAYLTAEGSGRISGGITRRGPSL
jgi:alpha-D-ribose 1-methylphosphonate 5-triphosphate diphosphatase